MEISLYISINCDPFLEYALTSNSINYFKNNLDHLRGIHFFNAKINPKCVLAIFDRSQAIGLEYRLDWAQDTMLVIRYGFPTVFVVDSKNDLIINDLQLLIDGNDIADYILLKIEDLIELVRKDKFKFLIDLEDYEHKIEEGEEPNKMRSSAMKFLREMLGDHGIKPIFDSSVSQNMIIIGGNNNAGQ